jgi:hypothetical protein
MIQRVIDFSCCESLIVNLQTSTNKKVRRFHIAGLFCQLHSSSKVTLDRKVLVSRLLLLLLLLLSTTPVVAGVLPPLRRVARFTVVSSTLWSHFFFFPLVAAMGEVLVSIGDLVLRVATAVAERAVLGRLPVDAAAVRLVVLFLSRLGVTRRESSWA